MSTIYSKSEYKLPNGQIISIQCNENTWEVGCWNVDDTAHWYKEFNNEIDARKEYERWKS
jgi:hypothetical protein